MKMNGKKLSQFQFHFPGLLGTSPLLKQEMKKSLIKFMFSKKATKIDEIFTVDLTLCSKCRIDGEDSVFVAFLENTNFTYVAGM